MTCSHCSAKTPDGIVLCERCQTTLRIGLVNVAAYYADLGRVRPGERVKARSAYRSTPPPDPRPRVDRIGRALDGTRAMLTGWIRVLIDDRPEQAPGPSDPPGEYASASSLTGWLEARVSTIVTIEWAGELLADVLYAERRLLKIVEASDTGWSAGVCGAVLEEERPHDEHSCACACHHGDSACDVPGGCGKADTLPAVICDRGLYATTGTTWIRCPDCGSTYDVAARREQMLAETRDEAAPISTIARALVGWLEAETSVERLTRRIRRWVDRGQLHSAGTRVIAGQVVKTYRIGEVLDLVQRDTRRLDRTGTDG